MRRKECERDAAFAWEVLKNSIYSTVSMVCPDGTPYATPVNIIGDEVYNALYFHCAGAGERWELLKNGAPVCVTAPPRCCPTSSPPPTVAPCSGAAPRW